MALALLVTLAVVGAAVTRRSLKAFRKPNGQSDASASTSKNWRTESEKTIFESLETTVDSLP